MNTPTFRIKHIGINTPDDNEAKKLLLQLCDVFGLEKSYENNTHVFAGEIFEVMKHEQIGKRGHIALQTDDVEGAIAYFSSKNIGIRESTIRKNANNKIIFAYLNLEMGGFAFHLTV